MGTAPVTKTIQNADADVFTAIAHPVRRRLLDQLAEGDQSVTQLTGPFTVSRQAISQHLHILLDVGLVSETRKGRERYYSLHAEQLMQVQRWLMTYQRFWNDRLNALGKYLEEQE
jgi:DNA-binding transcriptional ArsR family regulator